MTRKPLWVDGCSNPAWVKARLKLITQDSLQPRTHGSVGSAIRHLSGVGKPYNPSLQQVQQELDTFRAKSGLQKMAAQLYARGAQSAQPEYRAEAELRAGLQCGREYRTNVAQVKAPSPQTRPGHSNWKGAANMIEQNWKPPHKVVGGIESCQQNTDRLQVEPALNDYQKPARSIPSSVIRHTSGVGEFSNPALQRVEHKLDAFRDQGRSQKMGAEGLPQTLGRQQLKAGELRSKHHMMQGPSTLAWMKAGVDLIGHGELQCRPNCGTRDWSGSSAQGNGSLDMDSARTSSQAVAVLRTRLQRSITTDSYTYVKVLQMCLRQKDLLAAKEVHDYIVQSGVDKNLYVAVTLLNVYIKCGALLDARQVFDKLENKSVVTWNNMIAGYAKSDHAEFAIELFNQMRQEGARPNESTYLGILKACANPLTLNWGKEVHVHIRDAGFESDVRVGTALVKMYAECGCIEEAKRIFEKLTSRDVITWTVMIGGLAQHGCGDEAYRLFLQMRREGFEPNAFTYVSILSASPSPGALEWVKEVHGHASRAGLESDLRVGNALVHMYAKSGRIDDARLVFDRMEKRDVVTWTVMISGYAEGGQGVEAYRLFLQMRREGFEPDAITYVSILNASASAGALEWVKEVHCHARQAGLDSDLRVGNALVHMYAKSGSIDDAQLVFDKMTKRDVVSWTGMIGGLAHHGFGHEALELFKEMTADGVKPDGTAFLAVLSACCHGGIVDDGRRLFSAMKHDYGIEPDIMHYTCMVDLLGRAGHLEEAKLFIHDMPIEPTEVTWTALLGACRTYGNVELGELAAKEALKLEPNDASIYVLLSNIYAAAGQWENVSFVRTKMQERGVRKETGRSWIKVDDKVHQFVVGDTSHPEAKGIYTELNKLTEKLKAEGYIPDTRLVLHDINEEDKEFALCSHSEKLAIVYGLIHIPPEETIRIEKNLRVCPDCHTATKFISKVTGREIIARDANRFHHFRDGVCSCGDYW